MRKTLVAAGVALVTTAMTMGPAPVGATAAERSAADPARVSVDVATGIVDGQVLRVRGAGLLPGEPVAFYECPGTGACFGGRTGVQAVADQWGRVAAAVPVTRYRGEYMGEKAVDCAYYPCTMRIVRLGSYEDGYEDRAETPISFARVPTTSPTSVITPASLLPPVATVTVAVRGFTPGARLGYTCLGTRCNLYRETVVADQTGAASITLTVNRLTPDFRDCAVTVDCTLTVWSDLRTGTTVPLRFDPAVPMPLPRVTVLPDVVRTTEGIVGVRVDNASPADRLTVAQCATVPQQYQPRCGPSVRVVADANGSAGAFVAVSRFLTESWQVAPTYPVYYGQLADCATMACTVQVTRDGEYFPLATAPVRFTADPQLPTVRLSSAIVREGGAGTRSVQLVASLDRPAGPGVAFGWRTDTDYESHPVSFPVGATRVAVGVPITGNDQDDLDRTVAVLLTTITGAQPDARSFGGRIRVVDDDPTPTLDVGVALVSERAGSVVVPVRLSHPTGRRVELTYRTVGASARPGEDYVETVGVRDSSEGGLAIRIPIVDDTRPEPAEHFQVEIVAVRGARLGNGRADVWIGDDDA